MKPAKCKICGGEHLVCGQSEKRAIAQSGRASRLGREGQKFESSLPDQSPASSNGRTADFDSANRGSSPRAGTKARVAQRIERLTSDQDAAGSSHAASAKRKIGRPRTSTPAKRKEYLKLKARERRVRERAEAVRLGLTFTEYLRRGKPK